MVSTLLAPIGYVVQDVVADAMTVEAVPRIFAIVSLGIGDVTCGQEIVFGAAMAIVLFLMWRITSELEPDARQRPGRNRAAGVRLPRGAGTGRRLHVVDDRSARL